MLCIAAQGTARPVFTPMNDSLIIEGDGIARFALDRKALDTMPRKKVSAKDYKSSTVVTFEGVELHEVLRRAGVKFGKELKHGELSKYLLVEAQDGYKVVFALPELDPLVTENIVLLADKRDGKPLDDYAGALCIIVPHEKRNGRWVRQVKSLTIKRS
jgi:Oxidoreductase molybdopterin binding domain